MGARILRIAGWFSGIFFIALGVYFELIALWVLSQNPPNADQWFLPALYPCVPLFYGGWVIHRLVSRPKSSSSIRPAMRDEPTEPTVIEIERAAEEKLSALRWQVILGVVVLPPLFLLAYAVSGDLIRAIRALF